MYSILLRKTPYGFALLSVINLIMWFVPALSLNVNYTFLQTPVSSFIALIIGFVITLLTTLVIDKSLSETVFGNENSNAFMLFFMSVCALSTGFNELILLSLVNFVFSVCISIIIGLGEKNVVKSLFNSAFILGSLSFVSVLFLPLLYLVVDGGASLRRLRVVDIFAMIIPFFLPILFIFFASYIADNYILFNSYFKLSFITVLIQPMFYIVFAFIFILSLIGRVSLKNNRTFGGSKTIKTLRVIFALFVLSYLLGGLGLFLYDSIVYFTCISVASSIYIASFFLKSNSSLKTLVLVLFLSVCFISKYFM